MLPFSRASRRRSFRADSSVSHRVKSCSRFAISEQVKPGSVLEITLAMPGVTLSLVGRVAWERAGVRDGQYLHGVRFRSVTPDQREQFRILFAHENPPPVRVSCALAVLCQRNEESPAIPGIVRDLSDGGVCVRLPRRVAPGKDLWLQAATPFGQIVADAQVVWADPAQARPRGWLCRHGLRFLHVDPVSARPLRTLLDGIPPRAVVP